MKQYKNGLFEVLDDARKHGEVEFIPNELQLQSLDECLKMEGDTDLIHSFNQYKEYGLKANNTLFIYFDNENNLAIEW